MKRLEKLMNKRMIELWQEAHDYANKQAWVDLTQNVSFIFEAKFAELIVAECAMLVWNDKDSKRILEHFGVE